LQPVLAEFTELLRLEKENEALEAAEWEAGEQEKGGKGGKAISSSRPREHK